MTSIKAAPTKATASHTETTSSDNVISVAQWAETTAIARDGMFKCAKDLAEISRVASSAMVGGYADYGNEIREIGSVLAAAMIAGFSDTGRQLIVQGEPQAKVEDGFADMMKLAQRMMVANSRLAERQATATAEAYLALAAMPTCILGMLDGK